MRHPSIARNLPLRLVLVLAALLALLPARADEFGEIAVSADAMYTGTTYHGYGEMRVRIENRSGSKAHTVTVVYPANSYGGGNYLSRVSRSVNVAPNSDEVITLLQPPLPATGDNQVRVEVDGHHEGEIHAPANNHCNFSGYGGSNPRPPTILVSRNFDFDGITRLFSTNRYAATGTPKPSPALYPGGRAGTGRVFYGSTADPNAVETIRAEVPPPEWSDNWLAYTPFDAIALDTADLRALPAPVLDALGNYLAAGGNIFLAGQAAPPAVWGAAGKKIPGAEARYDIGFGSCYVFASQSALENLPDDALTRLHTQLRTAVGYWQSLPTDGTSANNLLPVTKDTKIPTRGIVIVMLLFILAIGPANLIVLGRLKRRTWMLWTIPAISALTTLGVFGYSFVREGFTPDTRISGLTCLDQPGHRATTVGLTAFYCPLTPSGGLQFDPETEATPLVALGYGIHSEAREVDWTQGQHFQHGWIAARVPVHFHIRKSEIRRERLELERAPGGLKIVNGLGATVKQLWLADADGKIYEVTNLPAGQLAGPVAPGGAKVLSHLGVSRLRTDFGLGNSGARTDALKSGLQAYLVPGSYIALLDGNPFIENALGAAASPQRTLSDSLVYGLLDPETTP